MFRYYSPKEKAIKAISFGTYSMNQDSNLFLVKEFILTVKISFRISQLELRPASADCCILVGQRGVAAVGFGYFGSEKLHITQEVLIAKQLFLEHPSLEVVQCKWVPTLAHKVIAVLNSDCFLRTYNTETAECLRVFCMGPPDTLPLMVKYNAEIDPETPVDFDFSVHFPKSKSWSIFVLTTSGDVSCILLRLIGPPLRCLIESYGRLQRLEDDAREEEGFSCILSSKQYPIVLITGKDSGQIIHSVLLPIESEEYELEEENMEDRLQKNQFVIYIKERLNLNLQVSKSPMQLLVDPLYDERYVCIHGSGVHLVTLKFLPEILDYFNTEENSILPTLSPSICRLLIAWKFGDHGSMTNQILGASYSASHPQKLLCVLRDKRTVLYSMPHPNYVFHMSYDKTKKDDQPLSIACDANNLFHKKDIMQITRNLLRNANQPFLCGNQEIPGSESSKLLNTAIKVKLDQITGIVDASQYLLGYINALEARSDEMHSLVMTVLNKRGDLKVVAESLAEHYEERMEQDEMLTKRLESILFRYHQSFPVITDQEKCWIQTFGGVKQEIDVMKDSLKIFNTKLSQKETENRNLQVNLTPMQIRQIKDEIANQHSILTTLITNLRQIHLKLSSG